MAESAAESETGHEKPSVDAWGGWRKWLLLLAAPLLLVGPALRPGHRFLPQLPVQRAPLAAEYPEDNKAASRRANLLMQDRLNPFLTDQYEIREQLTRGVLPLWEPKLGLGVPLLGGSIVGPFYPPNVLAVVLPPDIAAGWLGLFCLFIGGAGAFAFARSRGLSSGAAAVSAVAFQTAGWGLANLYLPMKVDAAVWLPWSLWAVEGLARGRRGSGFLLFLFTAFSFLAGWVPVAVFSTIVVACFAGVRLFLESRDGRPPEDQPLEGRPLEDRPPEDRPPEDRPPEDRPPRAWLRAAVFLLLGVLGASVQVLPTAEASSLSERKDQSAASIARQTIPIGAAASLVVPDLFGSAFAPGGAGDPTATWVAGPADGDRVLAFNSLEWNAFAGVGAVLLALVALIAAPRRAALPFVLLVLAWGFATGWPVIRLLYHLPGFNVGAPNRVLGLQWFLFPWLIAIAVQCLCERRPRALPVLCGGALVATVSFLWFWASFDVQAWSTALVDTAAARFGVPREDVIQLLPEARRVASGEQLVANVFRAMLASAALLAASVCALWGRRSAVFCWLPVLLVVGAEGYGNGADHVASRELRGELFPKSAVIDAIREAAGDGRVLRLDETPGPTPSDVIQLACPNLLEAYGIYDVTPYTVFTPRTLLELFEEMHPETRYRSMISSIPNVELIGHPVLDVVRVTAVLARRPIEHPRLEPVLARPGFHVYRRKGAPPAVHLVREVIEAKDDAEALQRLVSGDVDPGRQLVRVTGRSSRPEPGGNAPEPSVEADRVTASRFDARVDSTSGGILVFHEQFYPGWKAEVDGAAVELLRVNHTLRGVRVPPGAHTVTTFYDPPMFWLGLLLSSLALAAAAWLSLRVWR